MEKHKDLHNGGTGDRGVIDTEHGANGRRVLNGTGKREHREQHVSACVGGAEPLSGRFEGCTGACLLHIAESLEL